MSLVLKDISIRNFRNHESFKLEKPKRLIIIVGENASGKTNIVEALQLVTAAKSFRNPQWASVVSFNSTNCAVEFIFEQNKRHLEIKMEIENNKRSYYLNGKRKNVNEICGLTPGVIFIPDDLDIIKNSSEVRRELIDETGQQLSKNYNSILNDYKKTLKQRNNILKEQKERTIDQKVLDSWNENLVILGAMLFVNRIKIYKKLTEYASQYYLKLTSNEILTSEYIPSFNDNKEEIPYVSLFDLNKDAVEELLRKALNKVIYEEKTRGKTLIGPHRDEINFFINNREARSFASQGQQRSIALALKLGQLSLIRELSGNQPILLLDDVMSELDEKRRNELIKVIDGQIQTIITATDVLCFNGETLKNAQIIELKKS